MAPRISVCRKGADIFLTVAGDLNFGSVRELLAVVRQLLTMSMKCAAPGTPVTYSFKTRGKVDLDKMVQFQEAPSDQPCRLEACKGVSHHEEPEILTPQEKTLPRPPRNGLVLIKGGAF